MKMAGNTQSSQTRSGPTDADRELASAATALGNYEVSEWQIKRWREAGLLATVREFKGRGAGSGPVGYPPHAPAHAACLAEVLENNLTLNEACLVCFLRGFLPRERALKRAYTDSYAQVTGWLRRTAAGSDEPWTVADAAARLLARRSAGLPRLRAARDRLRSAGKPPSILSDVLFNVLSAALGQPSRLQPDTLLAFGMDGLTTPISPAGSLAEPADLELDRYSLAELARTAHESALNELEHARDALVVVRTVAVRFVSIVIRTHGLRLDQVEEFGEDNLLAALLGIPALLILCTALGKEKLDANVEQLRTELPRLDAMQRYLDELAPDLHRYLSMSATRLAALDGPEFERLRDETRRYFSEHPEDLPLLAPADNEVEPPQT
jgi:hypothetical protein